MLKPTKPFAWYSERAVPGYKNADGSQVWNRRLTFAKPDADAPNVRNIEPLFIVDER